MDKRKTRDRMMNRPETKHEMRQATEGPDSSRCHSNQLRGKKAAELKVGQDRASKRTIEKIFKAGHPRTWLEPNQDISENEPTPHVQSNSANPNQIKHHAKRLQTTGDL